MQRGSSGHRSRAFSVIKTYLESKHLEDCCTGHSIPWRGNMNESSKLSRWKCFGGFLDRLDLILRETSVSGKSVAYEGEENKTDSMVTSCKSDLPLLWKRPSNSTRRTQWSCGRSEEKKRSLDLSPKNANGRLKWIRHEKAAEQNIITKFCDNNYDFLVKSLVSQTVA